MGSVDECRRVDAVERARNARELLIELLDEAEQDAGRTFPNLRQSVDRICADIERTALAVLEENGR